MAEAFPEVLPLKQWGEETGHLFLLDGEVATLLKMIPGQQHQRLARLQRHRGRRARTVWKLHRPPQERLPVDPELIIPPSRMFIYEAQPPAGSVKGVAGQHGLPGRRGLLTKGDAAGVR